MSSKEGVLHVTRQKKSREDIEYNTASSVAYNAV